jgi:hypothetical protein
MKIQSARFFLSAFIALMIAMSGLGTFGVTSAAAAPALDAPCLDGSVVGAMQNKLDRTPIGLGESPAATQLSWTGEGFPYGNGGFDRTIIVTNAMNNAYQVFALNTETVHMTKHCGSIEEVKAYVSLPSSYNNAMRLTAMDPDGNMPKVSEIGVFYVDLSTNQLVELVHAADGPTIAEVQKHLQVVDLATGLVIGLAQASAGSASAAVSTETPAAPNTVTITPSATNTPTVTPSGTEVSATEPVATLDNAAALHAIAYCNGAEKHEGTKGLPDCGPNVVYTVIHGASTLDYCGRESALMSTLDQEGSFTFMVNKSAQPCNTTAKPSALKFSDFTNGVASTTGGVIILIVALGIIVALIIGFLGFFFIRSLPPYRGWSFFAGDEPVVTDPNATATPAAIVPAVTKKPAKAAKPAKPAVITAKALRAAVPTLSLPQAKKVAKTYPDAKALKLATVAALTSLPMSAKNAKKVYDYAQKL